MKNEDNGKIIYINETVKEESTKDITPTQKKGLVVLCVLFFIGLLILLYYFISTHSEHSTYKIVHETQWLNDSICEYENMGNNIVCYTNSSVSLINDKGKEFWKETIDMTTPMFIGGKENGAIIDKKANAVLVFNEEKVLGRYETKGKILTGDISSQGILATIEKQDEILLVNMYDKNGELLVSKREREDVLKYPMSIAISLDGKHIAIGYAQIKENSSLIEVYDFSEKKPKAKENQVFEGEILDSIVTDIKTLSEDKFVAIGNKKLVFYEDFSETEQSEEIELESNLKSAIQMGEELVTVEEIKNGSVNYSLKIYDDDGDLKTDEKVNKGFTEIDANNGAIAMYTDFGGIICKENGKKIFDGEFKDNIQKIIPVSGLNDFIFISQGKIQKVRLVK